MALVGDIIIATRRLGPDPPQVIVPPGSTSVSTTLVTASPVAGGSLPAAPWFVVATGLDQWGETLASNEATATTAGGNLTVRVVIPFTPGVLNYRVYIGLVSGSEAMYLQQAAAAAPGATTVNITALTTLTPGNPPVFSTAYLPDTDGRFVSVGNMYEWLNEALDRLGFTSSGFRDESGVATVSGQSMYQLPGNWATIDHVWFDGWEMGRLNRSNFYYHNTASGISWMFSISKLGANPFAQIWPQPNRSGGTTTLSGSMAVTDTLANVVSTSGFAIPFGLTSIDSGANLEIAQYDAYTATQVTGLVRGLGGTQAVAHNSAVQVSELNLRISGKRLASHYTPGQATAYLDVPFGMESLISTYMLYKFRLKEQQQAEAQELYKQFLEQVKEGNRTNRQLAGPTQAGQAVQRDVYGTGAGGGWFVQ